MRAALLSLAALLSADGGPGIVRLQAAVVVASSEGQQVASVLRPLERRLRTLLPYNSYKSFTEYTASIEPGQSLDLRLPDGRTVHLSPGGAKPTDGHSGLPIHVAIQNGEEFDSVVACDQETVFQVHNGTADKANERTFLVYVETCPGDRPSVGRPAP